MLDISKLKPGQTIVEDGELYLVLDTVFNKQARGAMKVKAKVNNLRTGANVNLQWNGGSTVEEAHVDKIAVTYSYDTGTDLVFLDCNDYSPFEIPKERLEWEKNFLSDEGGLEVNIRSYEGEILDVILPDKVALKITECEAAVKGNTATSALKTAVLETGFEVKVPLFIEDGEVILVNTNDGKYAGRA